MPPGAIVVLHACCHNPTGVDLTDEQWTRVLEIVKTRELVPFLDIAYQGFADGLDADGEAVRRFAAAMSPVFVANSFSKSFSLYGERVGALSVGDRERGRGEAGAEPAQARGAHELLQPADPRRQGRRDRPHHPRAARLWDRELGQMRERIKAMRHALVEKVAARAPGFDFGFVLEQRGMFSYSGLSKEQVHRLRSEYVGLRDRQRPHLRRRAQHRRTSTTSPTRSQRS